MAIAIGRDRGLDLWNERRRRRSAHVDEHARSVAEPASVRRPTVGAHRLAPADHVVTAPAGGVLGLEHDPAVDGENALPAASAAGEHEESRVAVGIRRRQHADARPIGVAEARGTVLARIGRCVDREGKKEEDENSDQHFSNGGAHGFGMRPGFGTEIWRVPPRLHNGDAAYRHIKSRQRLTKAWFAGPYIVGLQRAAASAARTIASPASVRS